MTDLSGKRVLVTGGAGFLGGFVCEKLRNRGCEELIVPRRRDYDLTSEENVKRLLDETSPDWVLHLAAEVGGIGINRDQPGRFFFANMAMGIHLLEQSRIAGVERFVQVGTICSYPHSTPVPFHEDQLWNGYPEATNAPYGIAKKALSVMLDGYHRQYGMEGAVVLPVNLYGPKDNFDLYSSHVIPALIRKCLEAKERGDEKIVCWGSGQVSREFLYVEDAAEGVVRAMEVMRQPQPINLGTGKEIKIADLVDLIVKLTGFSGKVEWDRDKPDGQPRRCLDTSRARQLLDWQAEVEFEEGLRRTIEWYKSNAAHS